MTPANLQQQPTRASSAGTVFLKVLGGAALWIFAGATFIFLPLGVMASDGCDTGDTRMICTVAGQNAVAWTPIIAAPTAGALGTWGLASRRELAPAAWMLAIMMLMATWMVVLSIAG
ncbi:hypothetical protein [Streptomyces sp. I05A-00742]|uniref:hypothetical protein n=1 Tax=Streptomyces sp. I05A-00742 TaxID=2732853 RepID=UPI0014889E2C|nr:hypothetical protein [Streptomyces sp. I05A-00742]